ncbi:MAG: hypothetical protein FLDDKLPJ_00580 [Phycisphaerae bacterium]|nr:hypothetical protein [Phycisphaerae bacterium]
MARAHPGLPRAERRTLRKSEILGSLRAVDAERASTQRVLSLENEFRRRVQTHVDALPARNAGFEKFNTSPFVLMIHCMKRGYSRISQMESDILPAKLFSSMETSAGRMVEAVTLPAYGWEIVSSGMHSPNSALDGKRIEAGTLHVATLKSGPRCLNDEMSENFADSIVTHAGAWAAEADVRRVDFSYGVLYGTPRLSNKKDWHILRNVCQKVSADTITVSPSGRWDCAFQRDGITVNVAVRIGSDWWTHLGGTGCLTEVCTAMIRACVTPDDADPPGQPYTIADLSRIVSTASVPGDFNVSVLQRSQLAWLFFLMRHFCDSLDET